MQIIVQFPFADLRKFTRNSAYRLHKPSWPLKEQYPTPFVRNFGPGVKRSNHVDDLYVRELFCRAKRAIRFPNLPNGYNSLPRIPTAGSENGLLRDQPIITSRRLLRDSDVCGRIEIVFKYVGENERGPELGCRGLEELEKCLHQCLSTTCSIHIPNSKPQSGPLIAMQRPLLSLLKYSTTILPQGKTELDGKGSGLLAMGSPLLFIYTGEELPQGLAEFRAIDPEQIKGADVRVGQCDYRAGKIRTWIMARGTASLDDIRALKNCVVRLHAEQEGLSYLTEIYDQETFWDGIDEVKLIRLDRYLESAGALISETKWGDLARSAVVEAHAAFKAVAFPAAQYDARERYQATVELVRAKATALKEARLVGHVNQSISDAEAGRDIIQEIHIHLADGRAATQNSSAGGKRNE